MLKEIYDKVNLEYVRVEVVYISSDKNQEQFDEFVKKTPFVAIPYKFERRLIELKNKFNAGGIPNVVPITKKGNPGCENGRTDVINNGERVMSVWHEQVKD